MGNDVSTHLPPHDEEQPYGASEARAAGTLLVSYASEDYGTFNRTFDHMLTEFDCDRVLYALCCITGSLVGEIQEKAHPKLIEEVQVMIDAIVADETARETPLWLKAGD